jgi:hypothetical protein
MTHEAGLTCEKKCVLEFMSNQELSAARALVNMAAAAPADVAPPQSFADTLGFSLTTWANELQQLQTNLAALTQDDRVMRGRLARWLEAKIQEVDATLGPDERVLQRAAANHNSQPSNARNLRQAVPSTVFTTFRRKQGMRRTDPPFVYVSYDAVLNVKDWQNPVWRHGQVLQPSWERLKHYESEPRLLMANSGTIEAALNRTGVVVLQSGPFTVEQYLSRPQDFLHDVSPVNLPDRIVYSFHHNRFFYEDLGTYCPFSRVPGSVLSYTIKHLQTWDDETKQLKVRELLLSSFAKQYGYDSQSSTL